MLTSEHQIQGVGKESNRVVVRRRSGSTGQGAVAETLNFQMEHEPHTDVMHVDMCTPAPSARIDVIEVGEAIGFPGQIVARVDLEKRIVYGVTIQRYSAFRRGVFWKYHMASVQSALQLLIKSLCAGLRMNHHDHVALPVG